MTAEEARDYLSKRLLEFAVQVCTIVFDTALAGVWLLGAEVLRTKVELDVRAAASSSAAEKQQ